MQPVSGNTNYMFRIPVRRVSEAYYIADESELRGNNNIAACASYLNQVRRTRNLTDDLDAEVLTLDAAGEEIYKEYVKEYMCEGQLYYYFKRRNYGLIPVYTAVGNAVSVSYVTPNYTFPLPDDEIEYGGRDHE